MELFLYFSYGQGLTTPLPSKKLATHVIIGSTNPSLSSSHPSSIVSSQSSSILLHISEIAGLMLALASLQSPLFGGPNCEQDLTILLPSLKFPKQVAGFSE